MCWGGIFDLPNKQKRLDELEREAARPDFWDDANAAQETLKERSQLSETVDLFTELQSTIDDCETLLELHGESGDDELLQECSRDLSAALLKVETLQMQRMLSGPNDANNAIVDINSGAGGTEAQDWCEMLLRMYLRWAEKKGFKTEILSINAGEEAGVKNVTVFIEGPNAFGYLRSERGVHRLVRISPFDSNARRHTSFASVSAVPDIEQEVEVDVRDEDLRVDTYRSSGAGGQHINKTDSAVRLTHLPTGVVVACQNSRSQHKNKDTAMRLLKAKLYEIEMQKKREEMEQLAGERMKIDFGSQIRSYVMHPYQMVKDLRTNCETGNVQSVMDGDLDEFVKAYLLSEEYNIG